MQQPKRLTPLIVSLVFLSAVGAALWQHMAIYDYYRLRNYQAPANVAALATATTMNDKMRKLFYVYHPSLEDKAAFNQHCTDSEITVVLGCYVSQRGIYIYDVNDPRLNGVKEVTAAHETLHAAYERLSSKEQRHIDALTAQAFSQVTDQRILDTIKQYRDKDASVVPNELHSILGTEVASLPPELEAYYKQYFTDRSKIVALSQQYQQAFTERQTKLASYDSQLKELQTLIDGARASLEQQGKALTTQRAQLDELRNQKQYDQYNAAVPGFNALVRKYNADVAYIRNLIDQYNVVVAERNALATEENQLIKAIDSRPSTITGE